MAKHIYRHSIIALTCLGLMTLITGCGTDSDDKGEVINAGAGGSVMGSGGAGGAPALTCEKDGLEVISTEVTVEEYGLQVRAQTSEDADGRSHNLILRLYAGRATAPRETGTVVFDGVNYKDCGICPLIMSECNERGACAKVFYASKGEIDITAMSENRFSAKLKNVVFDHVTVAKAAGTDDTLSIPVEGGDQWCVNDFDIDREYEGTIPHGGGSGGGNGGGGGTPAQCENPSLACVGETLNDFSLTNCGTGEQVSMRSHFEGAKAGWFVLTAGWCGACSGWMPQVVGMLNNPQTQGLKAAVILSESPDHMPATQRYCQQYAENYDIPIDMMFMDHNGTRGYATIFEHLWPYIGPDGRFGLPFNALINAETFEYVYADRGPTGSLSAAMQELLR